MSISTELTNQLNNDHAFKLFLNSIGQTLAPYSQNPIMVQLQAEVCQQTLSTSSYIIACQLRLKEGQLLSLTELDAWLSKRLMNQILFHSLEESLQQLRDKQSMLPVTLPINTEQLSDYAFMQNIVAIVLRNRFSFRNLKLELKIGQKLPGNILAMQRGYRLASTCGIQLGISGFEAPTRLLCGLIHFNYIKLDGAKLLACHEDKKIQSQLGSLHHMALDLGIELICSNLSASEELAWLKKANYFQKQASQVISNNLASPSSTTSHLPQSANIQQLRPAAFA